MRELLTHFRYAKIYRICNSKYIAAFEKGYIAVLHREDNIAVLLAVRYLVSEANIYPSPCVAGFHLR